MRIRWGGADPEHDPQRYVLLNKTLRDAELREAPPLDVLVRFAAYTGLRASEIAGLRIRDIKLAAGHVEVEQTVKRPGSAWTVGAPKSRRSTRTVPLLD